MNSTFIILGLIGLSIGWGMVCAYAYERGKTEGAGVQEAYLSAKTALTDCLKWCQELRLERDSLARQVEDMLKPAPLPATPKKTKKSRAK